MVNGGSLTFLTDSVNIFLRCYSSLKVVHWFCKSSEWVESENRLLQQLFNALSLLLDRTRRRHFYLSLFTVFQTVLEPRKALLKPLYCAGKVKGILTLMAAAHKTYKSAISNNTNTNWHQMNCAQLNTHRTPSHSFHFNQNVMKSATSLVALNTLLLNTN